jgi:c-di-GMP-binding flagellar brake protein YcgR
VTKPALTGQARAEVPGRILDLSVGGALLVQRTALEVGAIHDFAIEIGGQTISVQAEVRHCQAADRGAGYQIGVEFVGVAPHDQRRLREYLQSRSQ